MSDVQPRFEACKRCGSPLETTRTKAVCVDPDCPKNKVKR